MSSGRPPPGSIPTLTEVVPWPNVAPPAPVTAPVVVTAPMPAAEPVAAAPAPVVTPPVTAPAPLPARAPVPVPVAALVAPAPASPVEVIDAARLEQRVLADIQKQVDLMLEVRLREALAPVLVRATDTLVRDARKELTSTLRDIVAKAVARELEGRDGH